MKSETKCTENSKRTTIKTVIVFAGFVALLFATRLLTLTHGINNLSTFAFLMIAVPIAYIIIAGLLLGFVSECSIKKGICFALVLCVLSWGISSISTMLISPENIMSQAPSQDEIMSQIYEELDRQAYEHMLEAGIIEEGDVITRGPAVGDVPDGFIAPGNENGDYSEVFTGVVKSDPTSEALGIILNLLLGFGAIIAGSKVKSAINKKKMQNG